MKNILLLESIAAPARRLLDEHYQVLPSSSPFSGEAIAKAQPIHAIVTRGKGDVSQSLIDCCPDLEVIARCGVGLDNVDVQYATKKQVKVVNAPGSNAATVAEHTIALMLMLQRNLYQSVKEVKNNNWGFRTSYQGDEIRGKRLGILGLGNIGSRVAKLAEVFGMVVSCWEGKQKKSKPYEQLPLDVLLQQSDILTIHLPLVAETRHLIGEKELSLLPAHGLIINTSRGSIINEKALKKALINHTIGGFAADVLEKEPPEDLEFLKLPNVLITPHSASLTATTYDQICMISVQNVIDLLNGKSIDNRYIFNKTTRH